MMNPNQPRLKTGDEVHKPSRDEQRMAFRNAISNVEEGEMWEESFDRQRPNPPSQIIPGLYLGNIKTAAAYLLGRIGRDDDEYARISKIVTVLSADHHTIGIERFPESGEGIQRFVIPKYDSRTTNLLEDFDKAGEFIREGVLAYRAAMVLKAKDQLRPSSVFPPSTEEPKAMISNTDTSNATIPSYPPPAQIYFGTLNTKPQSKSSSDIRPSGVLVHCHAGISRSSTIVVAYLLKYHRYLFEPYTTWSRQGLSNRLHRIDPSLCDRAIEFVAERRIIVNPNPGFRVQLAAYVHKLDCSITDSQTGEIKQEYKDFLEEFDDLNYVGTL